jgi:hypothetical protein
MYTAPLRVRPRRTVVVKYSSISLHAQGLLLLVLERHAVVVELAQVGRDATEMASSPWQRAQFWL